MDVCNKSPSWWKNCWKVLWKRIAKNKSKVKPVDVNSGTYIDFEIEINDKDPKFKVNYLVKISKYKNIFAKGYIWN